MFEEIHDLLKLLLFLFRTRNVVEAHFDVAHLVGFGFAEVHCLRICTRALTKYDHKHDEQRRVKNEGNYDAGNERTAGRIVESDGYAVKQTRAVCSKSIEVFLELRSRTYVDKVRIALFTDFLDLGGIVAFDVDCLDLSAFKHTFKTVFRAVESDFGRLGQLVCDDERDNDKHYHADDN